MKEKNLQDEYKDAKDDRYNPAIREAMKLIMNSISGKLNEGLHLDVLELMTDEKFTEYYLEAKNGNNRLSAINMIGNKVFASRKENPEDKMKSAKNIYLGALIYDYSKIFMYEYGYSKFIKDGSIEDLLNTDTDAIHASHGALESWIHANKDTIVPHWPEIEEIDPRYKTHHIYEPNSKVFGSFENELSDEVDVAYEMMKKFYLITNQENPTKENTKARHKGLRKTDVFITAEIKALLEATEDLQEDKKQIAIKNIYDSAIKFQDMYIYTYEELFKNRKGQFLTCSFLKSVKNRALNPEIDSDKFNDTVNTIRLVYTIKQIKIDNFSPTEDLADPDVDE